MSSSLSEVSLTSVTTEDVNNSSDSESSETPQKIDLGKSKLLDLQYRNYVLKDTTNVELMEEPPSPKNVDEQKIFDHIDQNIEPARKRILMLSNMLVAESIPYGFVDSFQQSMRRSFLCHICNTILLKPYTFEKCGHSLCLPCLKLHEARIGSLKPSIDIFFQECTISESICTYRQCKNYGTQRVFPNLALESSITVFLANNPSDVQGVSAKGDPNQYSDSVQEKPGSDIAQLSEAYTHIAVNSQKGCHTIDSGLITVADLVDFLECAIHQKHESTSCAVCKRHVDEFTFQTNDEKTTLIRYLIDWSPQEVKSIVGDLKTLFGNSIECDVYKEVHGPTYIEDSWANLVRALKTYYSMPFYPYVGASSFISEGMLCCYRCLKIIVEAVCTFYRSQIIIKNNCQNIKRRKRCLCGTGCRLQYISETHMRDYEHSGIGCRGDQSMTIFGSSD